VVVVVVVVVVVGVVRGEVEGGIVVFTPPTDSSLVPVPRVQ
jgi:hypothetical protein